jgi:hypothetical protein
MSAPLCVGLSAELVSRLADEGALALALGHTERASRSAVVRDLLAVAVADKLSLWGELRPLPKAYQGAEVRVSVRLPFEVVAPLAEVARVRGLSLAEVVRRALLIGLRAWGPLSADGRLPHVYGSPARYRRGLAPLTTPPT